MRAAPALRAGGLWLLLAAVLGAAMLLADHQHSPLDDPDLAMQRPGFLDAVGARSEAPPVTTSLPARGRVAVVFFTRSAQQRPLLSALSHRDALPAAVDVVVVGGPADVDEGPVAVVTDPDGSLARDYALPVPGDGGYPVGYAIVGSDGTIRYRTLDPQAAERLDEVRTILRALP